MRFLIKRLAQGCGVLLGTLTLVFLIFSFVPDPARELAGQTERESVVQAFRVKHGLDKPTHIRYLHFMTDIVQGDLGSSYITDRPVIDAIKDAIPATLILAFVAILFASIVLFTSSKYSLRL